MLCCSQQAKLLNHAPETLVMYLKKSVSNSPVQLELYLALKIVEPYVDSTLTTKLEAPDLRS